MSILEVYAHRLIVDACWRVRFAWNGIDFGTSVRKGIRTTVPIPLYVLGAPMRIEGEVTMALLLAVILLIGVIVEEIKG